MVNVLFVCTANICRSPYMELAGRAMLGPDSTLKLSSAGTIGFRDKPMDATMATAFDHSPEVTPEAIAAFRSRRLTSEHIDEADVVLTAESEHRQFILTDYPATFRKVFSLGQFASGVQRVDSSLSGVDLVKTVASTSGVAQVRVDVADPYRRGRRAVAAAAAQIDELLAIVMPALEERN